MLLPTQESDPMPTVFVPIRGSESIDIKSVARDGVNSISISRDGINSVARDGGLSGVGLRAVLGEAMDAPNTLVMP